MFFAELHLLHLAQCAVGCTVLRCLLQFELTVCQRHLQLPTLTFQLCTRHLALLLVEFTKACGIQPDLLLPHRVVLELVSLKFGYATILILTAGQQALILAFACSQQRTL